MKENRIQGKIIDKRFAPCYNILAFLIQQGPLAQLVRATGS